MRECDRMSEVPVRLMVERNEGVFKGIPKDVMKSLFTISLDTLPWTSESACKTLRNMAHHSKAQERTTVLCPM